MAIAGNAGKTVKVKQYFLTASCPELATATGEMMALFKIEPGGEDADVPSQDGVLVENTAHYGAEMVTVVTKIYVCSQILQKEHQAALTAQEEGLLLAKRLTKLNVLTLMRQITGINPSPWGILRGVRPGKIAGRLLEEGLARSEIIKDITENYGVEKKKAQLLADIAFCQRSVFRELADKDNKKTVSIYIGIPYCLSKCLYCSFSSALFPKNKEEISVFFEALKADMEAARHLVAANDLKVQAVYIGGGTPTSLDGCTFGQLLELTGKSFHGEDFREFTVEAGRPDSIDDEKIEYMRRFGVTRTSINPQTMQEKTLALIGRRHTVEDIVNAFYKIRLAKIPVINMDVIAGLPGETERDMAETMARLAKLEPDNITVHTLAVKRGSLLKDFLSGTRAGENLELPGEAVVRNMLEIAAGRAVNLGMRPYYLYRQKYTTGNLENIGYAKLGTECLYNMQIIAERQTIIGIGPAAGTKAVRPDGRLESCYNPKDVQTYVKNLPLYLQARESLLKKYIDKDREK